MYIFGGILELTKELNELLAFDFKKGCFELIGKDSGAYGAEDEENFSGTKGGEESPGIKGTQQYLSSPTKHTRKSMYPSMSPSKTMKGSKMPKSLKVTTKLKEEKEESGLVSPTSIQMKETFIIKNADESFDAYWAQMRKKKMHGQSHGAGDTYGAPGLSGSPGKN